MERHIEMVLRRKVTPAVLAAAVALMIAAGLPAVRAHPAKVMQADGVRFQVAHIRLAAVAAQVRLVVIVPGLLVAPGGLEFNRQFQAQRLTMLAVAAVQVLLVQRYLLRVVWVAAGHLETSTHMAVLLVQLTLAAAAAVLTTT